MKKLAILFVVSVVTPCCVLAWLAMGALREEEAASNRQRVSLAQGQTEAVAGSVNEVMTAQVQTLEQQVAQMLQSQPPAIAAASFDDQIRQHWSFAQVGFALNAGDGKLVSPAQDGKPRVVRFITDNSAFLSSGQPLATYAFSLDTSAPPLQARGRPPIAPRRP